MTTQPIKSILTRDLTESENVLFCDKTSSYLIEIVNFSTIVFNLCLCESEGKYRENENLAFPMIFLHCIELVDGIQVLFKEGVINPCMPLVRSLFESYLSIRLLLENNDLFVERSLSWLDFCAKQNIGDYREFLKENYMRINDENEIKISIDFENTDQDSKNKISNLQKLLSRPQFTSIEMKYKNIKRIRGWYKLADSKLNNLRDVAKRFGCENEYILIYKQFSKVSHGSDYQRFIRRISGDNANEYILRDRSLIKNVPGFTGSFMISIFKFTFDFFMPNSILIFNNWYKQNIQSYTRDLWDEPIKYE